MRTGTRLIMALLALVAVAGVAAAQSGCPECDEDGDGNPDNMYWSVDGGALGDGGHVLADTDVATSHSDDEKGFWSWISICLSAFVEGVENVLGLDTGIDEDAHVEAYVSEDGVDLDASALGEVDFDESELGDLDGMTWEVMQDVNAQREAAGIPRYTPLGVPEDVEGGEVDACVRADLALGVCG